MLACLQCTTPAPPSTVSSIRLFDDAAAMVQNHVRIGTIIGYEVEFFHIKEKGFSGNQATDGKR